jgi:hypothetical protein
MSPIVQHSVSKSARSVAQVVVDVSDSEDGLYDSDHDDDDLSGDSLRI